MRKTVRRMGQDLHVYQMARLADGDWVALADSGWSAERPFATWSVDERGYAYVGHDFATMAEALADFAARVEREG